MPLPPVLVTRSRGCSLRGPWHPTGTEHRETPAPSPHDRAAWNVPPCMHRGQVRYPSYSVSGNWTAVQDEHLCSHDSWHRRFRDPAVSRCLLSVFAISNRARGAKSPATAQAGFNPRRAEWSQLDRAHDRHRCQYVKCHARRARIPRLQWKRKPHRSHLGARTCTANRWPALGEVSQC